MKKYIVLRDFEKQDWIIKEIEASRCKWLNGAFIYKNDKKQYHLVDEATGLTICYSRFLKHLESYYIDHFKERYEEWKKTNVNYKIQIERFEKLKLMIEYERGIKNNAN